MKHTRMTGAAAVAACVVASAATVITNPANNHGYAMTDSPGTWHEAEAAAVAMGGHLVTINNAAENAWLVATFGDAAPYWIGFTDEAVEGTWVWITGQAVTYTNWNPGEPNNATDEDWAHINWVYSGGWNDWEAGAGYTDASGYFHAPNDSYPSLGIIEVPEPEQNLAIAGLLGLVAVRFLRHKA